MNRVRAHLDVTIARCHNPDMMKPRLSVVIVNYNTRDLLRNCLQSLVDQPEPVEVIVVDNASNDDSAQMVSDEFPQVRLLTQSRNLWFCGGNNAGIREATAPYVLLLNPDTVINGDALTQLVDFLENPAHQGYAGVTARLIYPNGQTQLTCSRVPTLSYLFAQHTPFGLIFRGWRDSLRQYHWYGDWNRDSDQDVCVAPGSCLLMRRVDSHLNDDLWLYFPEDDLARRLNRPFRYIASAIITHHEKSATQNWLATQVYFRDLLVYTRAHHGMIALILMWLCTRPLFWGMALKAKMKS